MSRAGVFVLLASFAASVSFVYGYYDVTEAKANAIQACFVEVICKENQTGEFKRIYDKAGRMLKDESLDWFKAIFRKDWARDTPEFWESFNTKECKKNPFELRNAFMEFMLKTGKFHEKVCCIPDDPECVGANEALAEGKTVVDEYTKKGVCRNEETEAKKGASAAKNAGEGMKGSVPTGMMG